MKTMSKVIILPIATQKMIPHVSQLPETAAPLPAYVSLVTSEANRTPAK
jgi:hypothetical protein